MDIDWLLKKTLCDGQRQLKFLWEMWGMENKEIQEERVRSYFVQAANEILRGEGITNLSVRNVSEKAGYSYATLYNYFKNI